MLSIMLKDGVQEFSDLDVGYVLQPGPDTHKVLREYQIGDVLKCAGVAKRYKMLVQAQIADTRKRIVQCRNNLVQLELHLLKLENEHDCHGTIFDIMSNLSYDNVDVSVSRVPEVSGHTRTGLLQDAVIDLCYDDDSFDEVGDCKSISMVNVDASIGMMHSIVHDDKVCVTTKVGGCATANYENGLDLSMSEDEEEDNEEDEDGGDDKDEDEDNKEELNVKMKEDHIRLGRQYRVKPFM